jgi:hypothetical protein
MLHQLRRHGADLRIDTLGAQQRLREFSGAMRKFPGQSLVIYQWQSCPGGQRLAGQSSRPGGFGGFTPYE